VKIQIHKKIFEGSSFGDRTPGGEKEKKVQLPENTFLCVFNY
jgi:hypothetical protein